METNTEPSVPSPRKLEINENPVITLGDHEVKVNSITVSEGETGEIEQVSINFGDNTVWNLWRHFNGTLYTGSGQQYRPIARDDCDAYLSNIFSIVKDQQEAQEIKEKLING